MTEPKKAGRPTTDLITAGEAARLLGVTVNTFRQWVKRGRLQPARRIHGRLWLYDRAEVAALAASPPRPGRPRKPAPAA